LRPVFAAFIVTLVGGGGAETKGETDDKTENCEQKLVDPNWAMLASVVAMRWWYGRSWTNFEMQVIAEDQPPTKRRGSIISGVILP
jgi:hypothetical protein